MICPICKQENDDDRPLEIDGKIVHGGCQDCWEEQCEKEWWVEIHMIETQRINEEYWDRNTEVGSGNP